MEITESQRAAWRYNVSVQATELSLAEWVTTDAALDRDNVLILREGHYPAIRISGTWYKIANRRSGARVPELELMTDEDLAERLQTATVVIDRDIRAARGGLNA